MNDLKNAIKKGTKAWADVKIVGEMTLRDYFAAKAMQAVIKDQYENNMFIGEGYVDTGMNEDICAEVSYMMADAMLKARMEKNT